MNDDFAQAFADHRVLVDQLAEQVATLETIADTVIASFRAGNRLFLLGNGGSAADAQHIAAELVGRYQRERSALPAMALTTDTSALTAISNDYGYGHVFTRQVEAHVQAGDVLWTISTSGHSPNILEAAHVARSRQAIVVGFTGRGGGKLGPLCDHCFCVDHVRADRIQEIHQIGYHLICERIEKAFVE